MKSVIFIAIAAVILGLFVTTLLLSLAWNAVMPFLFDLPAIDFGKALALQVIVWSIGLSAKGVTVDTTTKK